jgi:hypothetical protein
MKQEKLSSGYFVVILSRVENFSHTFFHAFVCSRRRGKKENFHFPLLSLTHSQRVMNCSQMNTLDCLIHNSVAENLCKVSSSPSIKGKSLFEEKQIIG